MSSGVSSSFLLSPLCWCLHFGRLAHPISGALVASVIDP
jgi:hypothetical protein